jgi:hypothetical protein
MIPRLRLVPIQTLSALSLLAGPALAGVIRIADQPGTGPFSTLQAAVDAAPEGALLLVEAGSYGAATIDGKSLSIVAMPTSGTKSGAALTVKNLAAHQVVVVSGLYVASTTSSPGVTLTGNLGHVRLQGCTISGGKGSFMNPAHAGVRVQDCLKVVLSACTLYGGSPGYLSGLSPVAGGHGLQAIQSAVALYDCTLFGGNGSHEGSPMGGEGGDGCNLTGWGIFASGTSFSGGSGGGGDYIGCTTGGTGGDGLQLANAQAVLLDETLQAGGGGWSPCNQFGASGSVIESVGGIVTELGGESRKLSGAVLSSDGKSVALTLAGEPGDQLFLLTGFAPAYVFRPALGVWAVKPPVHVPAVPVGVVGPSGSLSVVVPTAQLPTGLGHGTEFLQGLVRDAADQAFLTGPLQVELLDRAGGPDCNANLVNDFVDLVELSALDCDKNLLPDACDIAGGAGDCNLNAIPDGCEIASGAQKDCNANGVPDACDLAAGVALDCNGNQKPDSCDIATGASLDVDGNGIPDECETHVPTTIWVDDSAPPGGDGSQVHPFQTISQGIAASFHGDTVLIRDGLYFGPANRDLDPEGREIVIRSESGPATCVIDCQNSGRGFRIDDGEGPNLKLMGLRIINGDASNAPADISQGGGILVRGASPTIVDCVIEACRGRMGGGIYAVSTSMQVRGCEILDCVAPSIPFYDGYGGGAYVSSAGSGEHPAAFVDTLFRGCSAGWSGGGLHYGDNNGKSTPTLVVSHCRFLDNSAAEGGGALTALCFGGFNILLLENTLVAGNTAPMGAGASFASSSHGTGSPAWTISGCTFANNVATLEGGALRYFGGISSTLAPLAIRDSILWANAAPIGAGMYRDGQGTTEVRVSSCAVDGGAASFVLSAGSTLVYDATNLELDPLFVDAAGPDGDPSTGSDNDYRLASGSPCSDAGDNALVAQDFVDIDQDGDLLEAAPLDLAKSPRFVDDPLAPDTGQGTAPLVDIGPYERQ